jgi:DNA-binding response OmpR family regulator
VNPREIRILIVEDDVAFQRVLEKRLAAEGYQVARAGDGRDGMKAIVTFDPHVVLSDWMMPHVDGLELCQSVKAGLKQEAPYFVLLTAKDEMTDRLLALETGADDYLVKPCEHSEILSRVRAGVKLVMLERELRRALGEVDALRGEIAARDREIARLSAVRGSGEGDREAA